MSHKNNGSNIGLQATEREKHAAQRFPTLQLSPGKKKPEATATTKAGQQRQPLPEESWHPERVRHLEDTATGKSGIES